MIGPLCKLVQYNLQKLLPTKKSYDQTRQHIKKQRHNFANKGLSSQSYGFSSSHVWMWELDYKESSKDLNRHFSKEDIQWLTNTWKDAQHHSLSEKCKKAKWLSGEALQIAVKREAKSKGEKERYEHLNAEFQRTARRDKKSSSVISAKK